MGTQSVRLSGDFSQALTDLGETITFTHRVSQALNTVSGDFTEVTQVQNITAIPSQVSKKDIELSPSKLTVFDKAFRFREADLSVSAVAIDDKIAYESVTYRIIEITHEIMGIYKVIGRKA